MNQGSAEEVVYIDLGEILVALYRRLALLIIVTILCGGLGYAYSAFVAKPIYRATTRMIVNSSDSSKDYVTSDNINSAVKLTTTYSIIITSDLVLDRVYGDLGMLDNHKELIDDIRVESVDSTQIMEVTVDATSPNTAYNVCDKIAEVAPAIVVDTVEAGSCKVIQNTALEGKPVSPNILKNTALAAFAGCFLVCACITLRTILNNKVQGGKDIKNLDLPILGVIPTYRQGGKG